jgi:hypothetical protein
MARFIFHVEGHPDDQEKDLPNIAAAKCLAVRYVGELICEKADSFWDEAEFSLIVMDETGLILFTLTLTGLEAAALRSGR